jgi:hypothetical protein
VARGVAAAMWRSLDEVHEIHEAARAVCDRCFVAIEVMCCCFLVVESSPSDVVRLQKVILSLYARSILGWRDREGRVHGGVAETVSCRYDSCRLKPCRLDPCRPRSTPVGTRQVWNCQRELPSFKAKKEREGGVEKQGHPCLPFPPAFVRHPAGRRDGSAMIGSANEDPPWELFSKIDANHDGSLDREEIGAMLQQNMGWDDYANDLCEELDANGDGLVSFAEFVTDFQQFCDKAFTPKKKMTPTLEFEPMKFEPIEYREPMKFEPIEYREPMKFERRVRGEFVKMEPIEPIAYVKVEPIEYVKLERMEFEE